MTKERADALGDRMKAYERIETEQRFRPNSLIYARLDGRSFIVAKEWPDFVEQMGT